MKTQSFSLKPLAPFRLDLTAWALKRRPINQIDSWDGETYSRVLEHQGYPTLIEVRQAGDLHSPNLKITAVSHDRHSISKSKLIEVLNKLLGLRTDISSFYRMAKSDFRLAPLIGRYLGLKPPRLPSVIEAIVNGIACQQLTLHVGLMLLNRLCQKSGVPVETPSGTRYSFPPADKLRALQIRTFRSLGFSTGKAVAIKSVSQQIQSGRFDPEGLVRCDNVQAIEHLLHLRGVGRWTAEYVLLRGFGRTDLFPGDDVGARNSLQRWLKLKHKLDYEAVQRVLAAWRPYAGLLYFHLLLDGLDSKGQLTSLLLTR